MFRNVTNSVKHFGEYMYIIYRLHGYTETKTQYHSELILYVNSKYLFYDIPINKYINQTNIRLDFTFKFRNCHSPSPYWGMRSKYGTRSRGTL